MKHVVYLLCVGLMLLVSACGGPIETLEFKSPAGDRSITVKGERQSPAGPIMVTVVLKVPAGEKPFSFEHHAGSLTNENCTAVWENDQHAVLTFTMSDGDQWVVDCYLMDNQIQAIKRFQQDGKSIFRP